MESFLGLSIPRSLTDVANPREMALVVYDAQIGILKQIKEGPRVLDQMRKVLEAARSAGMRVFFTRHLSLPRELMGSFQYRMAMAWQRVSTPEEVKPWFLRDAPGFQIVPELEPRASEAIFDKITMSALEGTPLAIALRDCGIRSIAIIGAAIEVGIEPTARHAADLGIIPVIVRDACGTGRPEPAARSLASLEFSGDSIVTDAATFTKELAIEVKGAP